MSESASLSIIMPASDKSREIRVPVAVPKSALVPGFIQPMTSSSPFKLFELLLRRHRYRADSVRSPEFALDAETGLKITRLQFSGGEITMKDGNAPWILGLSTGHNGAAALLHGDSIVVAIQEERLLRMKRAEHPAYSPSLAVRYCLEAAGISASDLSSVAVCGFSSDDPAEDVTLNALLQTSTNDVRIVRVPHHLAHAFGAFYMSGFDDSDVLIVDGHGGNLSTLTVEERSVIPSAQTKRYQGTPSRNVFETASLYFCDGQSFIPIEKHISIVNDARQKIGMPFFHTLGKLYAYIGHQIFGDYQTGGLDAAGKVMGLAPYGKPSIPVSDFYVVENGEFVFQDTVPLAFCHRERWPLRQREYENLAASAQAAIEEAVLLLARRLKNLQRNQRLCYAGGVALNSVANERIVREAGFSDVFIMPAAEDSGTAVGAAFYALLQMGKYPVHHAVISDSMGRQYCENEISRAVASTVGVHRAESDAITSAAAMLAQGKILGWFQGGSELGPRSLGQRSILCDPRQAKMKRFLNDRVKFREAFRPYAPVILLDKAIEWFDVPPEFSDSPFMLRVMHFQERRKSEVPAVVHVDGTGRIQTLTNDSNQRLFLLLQAFRNHTGIPVLLNTSLNTAGDPIAESPEDALWYLLSTGLDACVLEDTLVLKDPGFCSALDFFPKLSLLSVSEHRSPKCPYLPVSSAQGDTFWCVSGPVETAEQVRTVASTYVENIICVVVPGPLGAVIHAMDAKWRSVLSLIDGQHRGWEIVEELRRVNGHCSERTLYRLLGRLRFGSGVSLSAAAESATVSSSSTRS